MSQNLSSAAVVIGPLRVTYSNCVDCCSIPSISSVPCVLGVPENHLIETVLLSIHNICFGFEIKKIIFYCALFTLLDA